MKKTHLSTKESQGYDFPKSFLFGASTSAYQVEGGNFRSDWYRFELEKAKDWARRSRNYNYGQGSISQQSWDMHRNEISSQQQYYSGPATDYWNRYETDLRRAKQDLGLSAYRFSVEWARVETSPGQFDPEALRRYREMAKLCRELGMEPFVTLWHFSLPQWFAEAGGWANSESPAIFERYASKVIAELSDQLEYVSTMNEPWTYVLLSYLTGQWPHHQRFPLLWTPLVCRNLIRSHRKTYASLKNQFPSLQVGVCLSYAQFEVASTRFKPWSRQVNRLWSWLSNDYFESRMAPSSDWLGVQYYFHSRTRLIPLRHGRTKTNDLGWTLVPRGHYPLLMRASAYGKPIYVTESGIADSLDRFRAQYIRDSLKWIGQAIDKGADVRGYFYWSLLDNLEWDKGRWPRFGLYEVDYATLERKLRPSGQEYAEIIRSHRV